MENIIEDLGLDRCRFCEHYLDCKSSDDAESDCDQFEIDDRLFDVVEFFDLYR